VLRNWKLWLGFAVSAVALYLTFRDIRLDEFFQQLAQAQVAWLLPALAALMVTLILRAWRWSTLMDHTPFGITFHALNIGYMLNMTLPLRLGEIGRAFVIGERTRVRMARALSAVVADRMLDLAAVVAMFAITAQFIPMPPAFSRAALIGGLLVFALLAAAGIAIWQAARVERLIASVAGRIVPGHTERLLRLFRDVIGGFRLMNTPGKLAIVAVSTAGIWLTTLLVAVFIMAAFMPASLDRAALVMVMANLGGALPSAPGGIGVVQGFARESLVIPFGVERSTAVAYAFVWSLSQQLVLIVLGLFGLARVGLSFAGVAGRSQMAVPDPASQAGAADPPAGKAA
jgi:uncharacterized protein (TIRG00374 family)